MASDPTPPPGRPADQDAPLPVEIALGLEHSPRPLADPEQEAEVALWEARFAAFAAGLEPVAPPPDVLVAIERAIAPAPPARPRREPFWQRSGPWRAMTGLSSAVAAAAIGLLVVPDLAPWRPGPPALPPTLPAAPAPALPPALAPLAAAVTTEPERPPIAPPVIAVAPEPPVVASPPPAPAPPPAPPAPVLPRLVATVTPAPGQAAAFVATYDPDHRQILLIPATRLRPAPDGHTPELWLVPPERGAPPVLLGRIDLARAHTVDVPERFLPHARDGASLMVTFEPRGASTGRVRGPTFARGRLAAL